MTQELKERLCLAWERLNCGGWDAELLGEPPEGVRQAEARRNAMTAIESLVGLASIQYYRNVRLGGQPEKEWLRWYLVERYARPEALRERKARKAARWIIAALTAIAIACAGYAMSGLSGW